MAAKRRVGGSRRGVPKGDKRARTRASLLAAAREVIREKGYERTTLQDVARRAGMTSGAIYGNFRNRDDLFIALAETHWGALKTEAPPGSTLAEQMKALADAAVAAVPERRLAAVGYLTGRAYALTHDEIRSRAQALTKTAYDQGAAWVRSVAEPEELPVSPEVFVRIVHALTDGLLLQRILTPALVPDEIFHAAFGLLARPRARQPQRRQKDRA